MGRGQYSGTAKTARSLKKRIKELTEQIDAIDESAGPEPADKESDEWFRWNERRLNAMQDEGRGALVTERKRLQRQLDDINGGDQFSLFRDSAFNGEEQAKKEPEKREESSGYAKSDYSDKGKVKLISNDEIGAGGGEYQGKNLGSGKAGYEYTADSDRMKAQIEKLRERAPKLFDSAENEEVARIISRITIPDAMVTVYRATSGDSINEGDWVFLTEKQADAFARSPFSKKPKDGVNVVKARIPASMVGYTGKNLEFVVANKAAQPMKRRRR